MLMLMMRNVLATACCRFGSEGLVIKLNFCSDFEHKILKLKFRQDLQLKFGQLFLLMFVIIEGKPNVMAVLVAVPGVDLSIKNYEGKTIEQIARSDRVK